MNLPTAEKGEVESPNHWICPKLLVVKQRHGLATPPIFPSAFSGKNHHPLLKGRNLFFCIPESILKYYKLPASDEEGNESAHGRERGG